MKGTMHVPDHLLRTLDVCGPPADPTGPRAQRDLQRALSCGPEPAPVPRSRSAWPVRLALATGTLVVVTTGALVLPTSLHGDRAFASWTPQPSQLRAQEADHAAQSCRKEQRGGRSGWDRLLQQAEVAVADRRGTWTTVVLAAPGGFSALCLTDSSSHLFDRSMIGSIGTVDESDPGPRELAATDLGVGTMSAGEVSLAAGRAGNDVIGVSYASRSHGIVHASVSHGRFALWFPGDELVDAAHGVAVTAEYRDGTTGVQQLRLDA